MSKKVRNLSWDEYRDGQGTVEERASWDEGIKKGDRIRQDVQKTMLEAKNLLAACESLKLSEIKNYITKHPPTSGGIAFLIFELKSANARKGGNARHEHEKPAKAFVLEHWECGGERYSSKADFARIFVDRVRVELGSSIKERTIIKWLSKTPKL